MIPITFLAVEDDDVDMMSIRRAFSKLGLDNPVERAIDGQEAWEALNADQAASNDAPPKIVLLDLNMPRMNGHEFLQKFFTLDNPPDWKIFVLTTSDSDQDIIEAHKYNISGYILKADLLESLREAIEDIKEKWVLVA